MHQVQAWYLGFSAYTRFVLETSLRYSCFIRLLPEQGMIQVTEPGGALVTDTLQTGSSKITRKYFLPKFYFKCQWNIFQVFKLNTFHNVFLSKRCEDL